MFKRPSNSSHRVRQPIKRLSSAIPVLLAMLTLAAAAHADDRIDVGRDTIAFGDVTVGTPSRYEQVDVRNTTQDPLPLHIVLHQAGADYTVEAADGQDVNRTLAGGESVRYLVRLSPTANGDYPGTLAFYPGRIGDYRLGIAIATIVTLSGTGVDPVTPPQATTAALRPGTADMDIQVTGKFRGNTPAFAGCCRPRGTSVHPRVVRQSGRLGIRVINHGPVDESMPHVTLGPMDRRLLDPRTLPRGIAPRSIQLLTTGGYAGDLAPIPAGGHFDIVVRVPRGVPFVDRRLFVSIQGLSAADPNADNNQDYTLILDEKPRPPAAQPSRSGRAAGAGQRRASDIDVDADRDRAFGNVWPIETVHPTKDIVAGHWDSTPIRVHVKNRGPDGQRAVRLKVQFNDRDVLDPSGVGLPKECDLHRLSMAHDTTITCAFPLASGDVRDFVFKFWTGGQRLRGEKSATIDVNADGADPSHDPNALNNHVNVRIFSSAQPTRRGRSVPNHP